MVREHVELRARLDPWKPVASYLPVTLKHLYGCRVYMILGGVGGKLIPTKARYGCFMSLSSIIEYLAM